MSKLHEVAGEFLASIAERGEDFFGRQNLEVVFVPLLIGGDSSYERNNVKVGLDIDKEGEFFLFSTPFDFDNSCEEKISREAIASLFDNISFGNEIVKTVLVGSSSFKNKLLHEECIMLCDRDFVTCIVIFQKSETGFKGNFKSINEILTDVWMGKVRSVETKIAILDTISYLDNVEN